jgi:hypothetical protein
MQTCVLDVGNDVDKNEPSASMHNMEAFFIDRYEVFHLASLALLNQNQTAPLLSSA